MVNDRVVVGVQGWNVNPTAFYAAESAGAFNQTDNGNFVAYVTFWILSGYLSPTLPAEDTFLWGNLNGNTGWAIVLTSDVDGQAVLRAVYGDGAALFTADYALSSLTTAPQPSFVERLIHAALFLDETGRLSLVINGSLVAETESASAIAPSDVVAQLGCAPDGNTFSLNMVIVSCGYYAAQLNVKNISGQLFREARGSLHYGSKAINSVQLNWTHRYDFPFEMAVLPDPSLASPSPFGPLAFGAAPPLSLTDQGGDSAFLAPISPGPVSLVRADGNTPLFSTGVKNPDWYAGGACNLFAPQIG
jgi:hypothetical protein